MLGLVDSSFHKIFVRRLNPPDLDHLVYEIYKDDNFKYIVDNKELWHQVVPIVLNQIQPIYKDKIPNDESEKSYNDDIRIIWSIRLLRYIYERKISVEIISYKAEEPLFLSEFDVKGFFFKVRMSTDTVYLSDLATQRAVINLWREYVNTTDLSEIIEKKGNYIDSLFWYF